MKSVITASALIFFAISVSLSEAEPVQNKIEEGMTISAIIDNSVAPFKFQIRTSKEDGLLEAIDVFSPSGEKLQTIVSADAEMPCSSCRLMEFKDLNFDGYNDLLILIGWGSGGNMFDVWTYNPKKRMFANVSFDNEFANPIVDVENKILITNSPMGCCAGTNFYYGYNKDKFHLFKQTEYSIENKKEVIVVKELVRGKWKASKKYGDSLE